MVVTLDTKWVGKVVIVTGASSGIGQATAERLVEEGMTVVGLARRKDRLDEVAKRVSGKKGKFHAIKTDLMKEEEILKAFKWIKENLGTVHAIVNNAGNTRLSLFTESNTQNWLDLLQVNVVGLCIATRESIKSMKEGKFDGHIININSVFGHHVPNMPMSNLYAPSKHAVSAINEVVRNELANLESKIKVTSISPGLVDTEMIAEINKKLDVLKTVSDKVGILDPKNIAEAIVYVLSTPPSVSINELVIRPVGEIF